MHKDAEHTRHTVTYMPHLITYIYTDTHHTHAHRYYTHQSHAHGHTLHTSYTGTYITHAHGHTLHT